MSFCGPASAEFPSGSLLSLISDGNELKGADRGRARPRRTPAQLQRLCPRPVSTQRTAGEAAAPRL